MDIAITIFGISACASCWEANPIVVLLNGWTPVLAIKLLVTILVVLVIDILSRPPAVGSFKYSSGVLPRAIWLLPIIAGLPVLWNILVLTFELI